jgi:hypothetical protein
VSVRSARQQPSKKKRSIKKGNRCGSGPLDCDAQRVWASASPFSRRQGSRCMPSSSF